ncbi:ecdysone-induced protein 78C-like [Ostrinia furnacalis]|nr:ecdysone-induced protein 78C-like [Ostrinia furnacalis]XP_028169393.1 ecdysone-induced protein 78C-like [Ostrinia furnacalis]
MSRDSVRYGRVPKRSREVVNAENIPDIARNLTAAGIVIPLPEMEAMDPESLRQGVAEELMRLVGTAHRCNNTYTDELRRTIKRHALVVKEDSDNEPSSTQEAAASSTSDRVSDARSTLWFNVALRMTPAVQQVVEFAKRLPGFNTLPQDDQLILIKLGFFEVWITRVTRLSSSECLVFDDGTTLSVKQLEIIYSPTFTRAMLNYVSTMLKIDSTEDEIAIYTGSLLLCPYRAGLAESEKIDTLNRALGDALHLAIQASGREVSGRWEAFASAANEVRALGLHHHELLSWCRQHWPRLVLPALFAEMFDIPKHEEEPPADGARASAASSVLN